MNSKQQFILFIKRTFLFLIPVWILMACYFIFDPFHVLNTYTDYGSNFKKCYNRNKISTDVFLELNKTHNFKSFIFGSSRSSAFMTADWSPYINDPHPYHFDAFDENLKGVIGKLKYIIKNGNKIENSVIVICEDTFNDKFDENKSPIHIKDPRWDDINYFEYHGIFLKSFFLKNFFGAYFDLKFTGEYKPYMNKFFGSTFYFDGKTNDFTFPVNEAEIKKDSVAYFSKHIFDNKYIDNKLGNPIIKEDQELLLTELAAVLKESKANYKIIIGPNFHQKPYHPADVAQFEKYLGKSNIYDFSGANQYSKNIGNWYEPFHYRPQVGKSIFKEIYSKK